MSLEGLNVSRSPFAASRFHGLSRLLQLANSSGGAGVAVSSRSLVTQLTNRLSTCRLLPRSMRLITCPTTLPILRASASKSIGDAGDHERLISEKKAPCRKPILPRHHPAAPKPVFVRPVTCYLVSTRRSYGRNYSNLVRPCASSTSTRNQS